VLIEEKCCCCKRQELVTAGKKNVYRFAKKMAKSRHDEIV